MKKARKTTSRSTSKKTAKRVVRTSKAKVAVCDCGQLSCKDCNTGFWGKDQSLVLILSASIVVLVVAGLYLSGWL